MKTKINVFPLPFKMHRLEVVHYSTHVLLLAMVLAVVNKHIENHFQMKYEVENTLQK